jgi:hypothetical protein
MEVRFVNHEPAILFGRSLASKATSSITCARRREYGVTGWLAACDLERAALIPHLCGQIGANRVN